jgi:hypothetical protein
MESMTIWHGRERPIVARGKHQTRLLAFLFAYRETWHMFPDNKSTQRAAHRLIEKGYAKLHQNGYIRFTWPKG